MLDSPALFVLPFCMSLMGEAHQIIKIIFAFKYFVDQFQRLNLFMGVVCIEKRCFGLGGCIKFSQLINVYKFSYKIILNLVFSQFNKECCSNFKEIPQISKVEMRN